MKATLQENSQKKKRRILYNYEQHQRGDERIGLWVCKLTVQQAKISK